MINYEEFCAKFCEIEYKYKLFEIEFQGIRYWKYARYYIYTILSDKLFGISSPFWLKSDNQWRLPKYIHNYQRFTDTIFHNPKIGGKRDILLFSFSRRIKDGNKYLSPITDEIALHLKRSRCVIELPYCGGYYRPTPIKDIKYFDVWDNVGESKKVYVPINRGQLRKQLLSIFEKEFDIIFTGEEKKILLVNINYFIMYRDELIENFKKLILNIKPKLVLYTTAYLGDQVILTEALKELRIPGVEILHGYVSGNNFAYSYSEIGLNDALPDYIFAYSQVQKNSITWGIPKEHIRVVGYPYVEKRSKELLAKVSQEAKRKKKCITFISNTNKNIEKYINELAKSIDHNKFEIVFKLHPQEYGIWKNVYSDLSKQVRVIDNNEKDVHCYLAYSDYVIGINSTALFEAAIYPVDIFILKDDGHQFMNILLEAKRAILVQDCGKLVEYITSGKQYYDEEKNNFFEKNALENINNEIEDIIKSNNL